VQLTETLKCLEQMSQSIVDLTTQVRALGKQCNLIQREYTKEQKQWQKLAQKKKKNGGAKHQSGIAKPSYISPELCKFIGKDVGTEIARTEVIRLVADYIKKHKLQDEEKRKVIVPNKELASLLYNPQNEEITFFNLQKMMAAHYKNPNKETSANLTV
jgi:chromatin remodeling complex protein RSC6